MSRSPETSEQSESAADGPSERVPEPPDRTSPPETPGETPTEPQSEAPLGKPADTQSFNPVVFFVSATIIAIVALIWLVGLFAFADRVRGLTPAEEPARADAIVALPGGAGTLDELFEEWTSQQLGLHQKPIGLLGSEFWAPLVAMIDHMVGRVLDLFNIEQGLNPPWDPPARRDR